MQTSDNPAFSVRVMQDYLVVPCMIAVHAKILYSIEKNLFFIVQYILNTVYMYNYNIDIDIEESLWVT